MCLGGKRVPTVSVRRLGPDPIKWNTLGTGSRRVPKHRLRHEEVRLQSARRTEKKGRASGRDVKL